jgi:hypothetical protein
MSDNVPIEPLAAQVKALMAGMDALDRGLVDAGVLAAEANARSKALEVVLRAALRSTEDDSHDDIAVAYRDPIATRVQARKRRIEQSGFRLIAGGAQ